MNDELPSRSTRRSSSYRNTQPNSRPTTRSSTISALSATNNKKSKLPTIDTATITIRGPAVQQTGKPPKNKKQTISVQRKRKKNQYAMARKKENSRVTNVISTDDEAESVNLTFGNMIGSNVSSNSEMDDNGQEHLNISADSFDSSQTTDIENNQEQQARKTTAKSKYDVLQLFTKTNNGDFLYFMQRKIESKT